MMGGANLQGAMRSSGRLRIVPAGIADGVVQASPEAIEAFINRLDAPSAREHETMPNANGAPGPWEGSLFRRCNPDGRVAVHYALAAEAIGTGDPPAASNGTCRHGHTARLTSVWKKSSPLNSKVSPVALASA